MRVLVLILLAGCTGGVVRPTRPEPLAATPERLERGGYLVNSIAPCGVCHTPRIGGTWLGGERTDAFLAGGGVMRDDSGFQVAVPNISQDRQTGIGAWTDDEILRALRDGVSHDGRLLTPLQPFLGWAVMSDEDARAIVVYLRSTAPAPHAVPRDGNRAPFLYRVAAGVGAVHHAPAHDVPAPDAGARGAYLAKVGVCWQCHSLGPRGPTDDPDRLMAGSEVPLVDPDYGRVHARNLTPDRETGLGRYTAEQIKQAVKTGRRLDGKPMAPPMSLLIPHLSTWSEDDLDALVAYLRSLRPIASRVPEPELTPAARAAAGP